MKEELINKIEEVVNGLGQNSFHSQLLQLIVKMLQKLKPDIIINRYLVIDDFVSIELFHKGLSDYVDIEITKSNIEIRGDGYEMIYFFDRDSFELKYTDLIVAFFKGEYRVMSYFGEKGKKEAFGIIWNNESLMSFNNEKEGVNFFKEAIKKSFSKDGLEIVG